MGELPQLSALKLTLRPLVVTEQGWDIPECSCLSRRLTSLYVNTNPFCMYVAILVLLKLSDWNRVRLRGGF